jgi:hypothetical protein
LPSEFGKFNELKASMVSLQPSLPKVPFAIPLEPEKPASTRSNMPSPSLSKSYKLG